MSDDSKLDLRVARWAAAYRFTFRDKVVGAFGALRLRLFPLHPILVAGPYVGEFGHELMDWQAWVRGRVGHYREVHVITFPGRDYLYPGCQVHYHDVPLEKAGYRHGRMNPAHLKEMAKRMAAELGLRDYDLMTPLHVCTHYHRRFLLPAKFELLNRPPAADVFRDIAFHFRSVKKEGPDRTRNYPPEMCDRLVAVCREQGLSLCCVGHPRYSYCPAGVEDLRAENLGISATAISSARLLVGELSGPIHLAQLCGVPIVIWADGQWRLDNCERWNVFRVPTYVVANDTHRPNPVLVGRRIVEAMNDLRARTDGFRKPSYTLPR
jgi:hypothetical protein